MRDRAQADPRPDVRTEVEARARQILARVSSAKSVSDVEEAEQDFAVDRAEAVEDFRRDLVQNDGDGDVLNVSTNRLETRHEQRHRTEEQPESEMTIRERVERRVAEIHADLPTSPQDDDEGNRSWRR